MEYALLLLTLQGLMGAFDTIYHHELTERLPWRQTAGRELWLHGIRAFFYSVIFFSLAWFKWQGVWAWVFITLLLIEVGITLWDFVIEDQTRRLPATERITHTLLALNYGAALAYLIPELMVWSSLPSGFSTTEHGLYSWILTLYSGGVLLWAIRDYTRSNHLMAQTTAQLPAVLPLSDAPNSPQTAQKILVTGGTGMIGTRLCQALINEGHHVTILTRHFASAAEKFTGNVRLIDDLARFHEPQDIIINLAGAPISVRWTVKNRHTIMQSRMRTTQAVLDFIERSHSKPHTLISGSAIGVYGTSDTEVFTEASPIRLAPNHDFAAQLCQDWERLANQATAGGVRVCNLRTGVVLGKNGGILAQLLFSYEFGMGGKIGSGKQILSWIHQDDLLGIIGLCLRQPSLSGAINATAPHPVSNAEFSQTLAKTLRRPNLMTLPAPVMSLMFGEMAHTLLLQGQRVLPQAVLNIAPKASTEKGFVFKYPTIEQALQHLLRHNTIYK